MFDLATHNLCVHSRFATQMDGTLNLDLRSLMSDSELILNLKTKSYVADENYVALVLFYKIVG